MNGNIIYMYMYKIQDAEKSKQISTYIYEQVSET